METVIDCGYASTISKTRLKPEERDCGFSASPVPVEVDNGADDEESVADSSRSHATKRK